MQYRLPVPARAELELMRGRREFGRAATGQRVPARSMPLKPNPVPPQMFVRRTVPSIRTLRQLRGHFAAPQNNYFLRRLLLRFPARNARKYPPNWLKLLSRICRYCPTHPAISRSHCYFRRHGGHCASLLPLPAIRPSPVAAKSPVAWGWPEPNRSGQRIGRHSI